MQTPPSPSKYRSVSRSGLLYQTPPSNMSRLPTISTPSRASSSTGVPTPSSRRPRSSLGVSQHRASGRDDDPAAEAALQEALKHRPPSALRNVHTQDHDPDTPTGLGVSTRTPGGLKARTPSALGHGHHPTTPSTSRAVSRVGGGRPSIGSATPLTTRRVSMASSTTSATPYGRRPESRAAGADHWSPSVGERVRMQAMGMEGTLRYVGETEFKAGIWAGVEIEGGFAGKGKNDGSVNGITYFTCPPLCGVFILAVKLSAPTSGVSRPASVASSHLSFASSTSYHTGRATPSLGGRTSTATPSRGFRSVSTARGPYTDEDARPVKTLLGNSSSSNAAIAESKITAGSRASKYIGMTAKQLENSRSGLGVSVRSAATPKPSRVSMGGPTPGRPRASLGTSLATPRARVPRASEMPPPPSPGMVGKVQAQQSKLEEELRELREKNAQLEEALANAHSPTQSIQPLHSDDDVEALRDQAEMLRRELDASHADATDATKLAEELQLARDGLQNILAEKEKQLGDLRRDMKVAAERAQGELDAGMEAKKEEVARLQERAEVAEQDGSEMRALVEELTQAGQATISLYENKQYDLEDKIRSLEEKSRLLEDRLAKAREESEAAAAGAQSKHAISAAEIDNETLTAQLKHFQNRVSVLEEELEEVRTQAEADGETWKARLNKAKASEKAVGEKEREAKEEVKKLERAANGAKTRIAEMGEALKENRGLLEVARAEIETMRGEVAEVASMRTALQSASDREKAFAETEAELEQLKTRLDKSSGAESQVADLQSKIVSLESQLSSLNGLPRPTSPAPQKGRLSTSSNPEDVDKRLRGFQHIISDLSAENAELKEKYTNVMEEVELLKEENKLLEETKELTNGASPGKSSAEVLAAQATIKKHEQTIQELNREMAELESLIESKIYREDELENRLADVEKQLEKHRAMRGRDGSPVPSGHSRSASSATAQSTYSQRSVLSNGRTEERCELCEGPHDLDACPVFAGNMMPDAGKANGATGKKSGRWCADCESSEHDTAECPMAEDVF